MTRPIAGTEPGTALVLGGGGYLGGYQVGMVRALFERGVKPDMVLGTSIGSVQGAMIAADPTTAVVDRMVEFWHDAMISGVMKVRLRGLLANGLRLRPALASQDALRDLVVKYLGSMTRIEDLALPYQCAAASIERATVRYFDAGPLLPAVMASSAVPGLWPPVKIGNEHFIDGGVAETVPMIRAISCGATKVYVLRLRQREIPLKPPRWPWQLGGVVFEVSRRHRLGQVINMRPDGVSVYLLPTGEELLEPPDNGVVTSVREALATITRRIDQGYKTTCAYLDERDGSRSATIRAKHRYVVGDVLRSYVDRPLSPFVVDKLQRHFELLDQEHDGLVDVGDFLATADRVAQTFGHAPDGHVAGTLRSTFTKYWEALCRAADVNGHNGMGGDAFTLGISRLTTDPAAYDTQVHPVIAAILDAADTDGDEVLNPEEIRKIVTAFGVSPADARKFALRLDTNGDGVISIDELDEAYHDYFTSDEPYCVGNVMFGNPS